ncbi:tumor necrosis factor receptor superfamily member 18 [Astyanax mexicanus]|uniref:tumor necrosis factor receptor superfamily member 18 n=1 Tax=Astyanax mexicanus TaxID=7994 RepID=UPI0020CB5248|nr:tumor necrosis factor receptor superfamily member 18 [Astyanax mexicanus]
MDSVELWVRVWTLGCVLSLSLAVSCNWRTQYEYNGKCCDACPAGTYSKELCGSECLNCTAGISRCSCGDKHFCENNECSVCVARKQCSPGQVINRTGLREFMYICIDCPENMYSNEERNTCEPIADCKQFGLGVLFPGNRTHNARCGWQDPSPPRDSNQWNQNVIVVCLAVNGVICLALLVNDCVQRFQNRRRKSKRRPTTRWLVKPSDECGCKLSKEEMGNECDQDSDVSGDSSSKYEV